MIAYSHLSLQDFMQLIDPGYGALMWFTANSGMNVWLLHLVGGALFAFGLAKFCLIEAHPWLAMTVAIPYLVIVVAMGYDRQAVAIGFVLLAIVALRHKSLGQFIGGILLATSMHVTSLVLMPLLLVGSRINKVWVLGICGPIFVVAFVYVLQDKVDAAVTGYFAKGYSSSGTETRLLMNAIPAFIYLAFRRTFDLDDSERLFANVMSIAAVLFVVFFFLSPSSTVVDRLALYVIPVQIFVLGRLPFAFGHTRKSRRAVTIGVVVYSALVMIVWLSFADNAIAWVPYSLFDSDRLIGLSF